MNSTGNSRIEVIVANHVLQGCVCLFGAIWLTLAGVEIYNFVETSDCCRRRLGHESQRYVTSAHVSVGKKASNTYLRFVLFANSIMCLNFMAVLGFMSFRVPFVEDCTLFGRFVSASYTMTAQTSLVFLNEKTLLVGGFAEGRFYLAARKIASVAIKIFIPFVMLPLGMGFTIGMILETEQICTIIDASNYLGYIFAVGNFAFSSLLMYLFVEPLRQNAERMKLGNRALSRRIVRVALRNSYLAIVSLGFSTMASIMFSIFSTFAKNNHTGYEFLLITNMIVASVDTCVNGICIKAMSTVWLPHELKTWLYPEADSSSSKGPPQRGPKTSLLNNQQLLEQQGDSKRQLRKQQSSSFRNQFSYFVMSGGSGVGDDDESQHDARPSQRQGSISSTSFSLPKLMSKQASQSSTSQTATQPFVGEVSPQRKLASFIKQSSFLSNNIAFAAGHPKQDSAANSSLTTADSDDDIADAPTRQHQESMTQFPPRRNRPSSVDSVDVDGVFLVSGTDDPLRPV